MVGGNHGNNQCSLYEAIAEADSHLRRALTLNHAIQRLMVLDAIVEDASSCGSDPASIPHAGSSSAGRATYRRSPPSFVCLDHFFYLFDMSL
jgi:hypothetical protein